jgi:hypothetical protein
MNEYLGQRQPDMHYDASGGLGDEPDEEMTPEQVRDELTTQLLTRIEQEEKRGGHFAPKPLDEVWTSLRSVEEGEAGDQLAAAMRAFEQGEVSSWGEVYEMLGIEESNLTGWSKRDNFILAFKMLALLFSSDEQRAVYVEQRLPLEQSMGLTVSIPKDDQDEDSKQALRREVHIPLGRDSEFSLADGVRQNTRWALGELQRAG